jgi:hypothetical protein
VDIFRAPDGATHCVLGADGQSKASPAPSSTALPWKALMSAIADFVEHDLEAPVVVGNFDGRGVANTIVQ